MSIPNPFRPVCGVPGGGLPPGYTLLKAVRSSGDNHVDTGIAFAMDMKWVARAEVFEGLAGYSFNGAFESMHSLQFGLGLTGLTAYIYQSESSILPKDGVHEYVLDGVQRRSTVDGIVTQSSMPEDFVPTAATLWLGGRNSPVEATKMNYPCDVYSSQFYKAGKLISNMLPALDPNGVACLYDTVRGQAFYSATSTPLTPIYLPQ